MSPIAKIWFTLVRCCLSTLIKPCSVTLIPAKSAPINKPFGLRPTATNTASNSSDSGAPFPSKETLMPSGRASMAVTLVSNQMFLYCVLLRLAQGVTKSLSQPGII